MSQEREQLPATTWVPAGEQYAPDEPWAANTPPGQTTTGPDGNLPLPRRQNRADRRRLQRANRRSHRA